MVCTVEKANLVVNRMLEEGTLGMLCCVVVDEVHMLADAQRGGILESLCTKILFHSAVDGAAADAGASPKSSAGEGVQVSFWWIHNIAQAELHTTCVTFFGEINPEPSWR